MSLYSGKTYTEGVRKALQSTVDIDKLAGSKIFITGASGLIGSYITDILLEYNKTASQPISIYVGGRSMARLEARFGVVKTDFLEYVQYDVNSAPEFDFPVDYIIHAASNAYPSAFKTDPVGTITSNIDGTLNLLNYGKDHGMKRFLYVSSGEVYGQGDLALESFTEDYSGYVDPVQARSCYPMGKRAAETLCVAFNAQYGTESVIVRPCHTYGPNATGSDNRATVQFVNDVLAGKDIVMKSPGLQFRSYCYIPDCASAILTVLIKGKNCNAYNIANADSRITIADFAQLTAKLSGRKVVFDITTESTSKVGDTPIVKQVLDSSKLEGLGWKGCYTAEEGISHMLSCLKEI